MTMRRLPIYIHLNIRTSQRYVVVPLRKTARYTQDTARRGVRTSTPTMHIWTMHLYTTYQWFVCTHSPKLTCVPAYARLISKPSYRRQHGWNKTAGWKRLVTWCRHVCCKHVIEAYRVRWSNALLPVPSGGGRICRGIEEKRAAIGLP